MARSLIVNADDFGQAAGVNKGIIEAHERGIVTSASLMVRWPAAREAADYARKRPLLSLGLHFDLGEWMFQGTAWKARYEVVLVDNSDVVRDELDRQLQQFRALVGADPTHIDGHQHCHRREPAKGWVLKAATKMGIPVRDFTPGITYCGDFYGQNAKGDSYPAGIRTAALVAIIEKLVPGFTEIGCHPGDGCPLDSSYVSERATETVTLSDLAIREAIARAGVRLCSFRDCRIS
jgi:chitin disaccharide deacetylase